MWAKQWTSRLRPSANKEVVEGGGDKLVPSKDVTGGLWRSRGQRHIKTRETDTWKANNNGLLKNVGVSVLAYLSTHGRRRWTALGGINLLQTSPRQKATTPPKEPRLSIQNLSVRPSRGDRNVNMWSIMRARIWNVIPSILYLSNTLQTYRYRRSIDSLSLTNSLHNIRRVDEGQDAKETIPFYPHKTVNSANFFKMKSC